MKEIRLCEIGDRGSSNQKNMSRSGQNTISKRLHNPIMNRRGSYNFEAAMNTYNGNDTVSEKIYMAKKNQIEKKKMAASKSVYSSR